ncbi:MAG: cupin [candidate division Zixibacteria bacterium]|nr:cupin [candidate division Zixibacteria bacterium]
MNETENIRAAEACFPTTDLKQDLSFYTQKLGFRLDMIFPADDPAVAVLSGHGLHIRLERGATTAPGTLRLLCDNPDAFADGRRELIAPNRVRIVIAETHPRLEIPKTQHAFMIRRLKDNTPWVIGRARMHYRDLIPGRLGGSIIASHIRIPDAGPVPDMVHYHTVGFQLIFCYHGWVRLVYEDQGPPFVLRAGDCVIQPPEIRHRVLEASENLQVIEIGVPAEHITTIDHDMELPTPVLRPDRMFGGQRFCRSEVADAVWSRYRLEGFETRDTGIGKATAGVASVQVVRPAGRVPDRMSSHTADILFVFVMSGTMTLCGEDHSVHTLEEGDACTIPPGFGTSFKTCSPDLELLEVALPAQFDTHPSLHGSKI